MAKMKRRGGNRVCVPGTTHSPQTPDELAAFIRNAIDWATAQLGSTEYRFRCLGFVEDAYERGNSIEVFGGDTAKESADQYGVTYEGTPPLGAFVFYDYVAELHGERKNWGHVGLYIGDGKVIHGWDTIRVDGYIDVETLPTPAGFGKPKYIGWTRPERVLEGNRKRDW